MSFKHWRPSASLERLRKRAALISDIRRFFETRGYLEVETPVLARFGVTCPYLNNIQVDVFGRAYCLQTSPEYHMKRLLAAGSGPIYQLARVFRDDELGRWHNPEFTLLEWYQLQVDHHGLMDEVDVLLQALLGCGAMQRWTYEQVFLEQCGLDPFTCDITELKQTLIHFGLDGVFSEEETDRDQYLFLLMSHVVEPALANETSPVALYDFPPSQAALAQVHQGVAERFEVYVRGVELANGFHELRDHSLQADRFEADNKYREHLGLQVIEADGFFLEALREGLPPCSGVALGVDRLMALAFGAASISEVMSFDVSNA